MQRPESRIPGGSEGGYWRSSALRPLAVGSYEAHLHPPLNLGLGGTSLIAVSVIDFIAGIFLVFGGVVAFRPKLLLRVGSRALRRPRPISSSDRASEPILSPDQQSVLRMIGIMVMAFAFTFGTFSTLIFVFSRSSFFR